MPPSIFFGFEEYKSNAWGIIGLTGNTGNARNILSQYRHVHIEASRDGIFYGGKKRVDIEQFMKTKFDETKEGNVILQEQ